MFLLNNQIVTSVIPAFTSLIAYMQSKLILIGNFDQVLLTGTKGVTNATKLNRELMTNFAVKLANAIYAHANAIGDEQLKIRVIHIPSQLKRLRKDAIADACDLIANVAQSLLSELAPYGIVITDITNLQTSILTYVSSSASPRNVIVNKKVAGNQVNIIVDDLENNILKTQMDPIVRTLSNSNPMFVEGYFNARSVVDLGKNVTKLSGRITDSKGNPLKGTSVSIRLYSNGTVYNAVTDFNGNYFMQNLLTGDYEMTVSANGYLPVTEDGVHLVPGRETTRNIQLNAAA